MLTFLRKIRKSLIETGSTRKYVLYAIGEIALVVLGILIALQINNWNEHVKTKKTEKKLLQGLVGDLEQNQIELKKVMAFTSDVATKNEVLLELLNDNKSVFHDSLQIYFGYANRYAQFIPQGTAYEETKSFGLGIITNNELRSEVISLFGVRYTNLDLIYNGLQEEYQSSSLLFNRYLSTGHSSIYKIPNDFNALKSNKEYMNTITFLTAVQRDLVGYYQGVLDQTDQVRQLIENELD